MGGERLDTRNPTSKLMLTILAGVATWEREIMLERQREGIAKAKAAGKYKGRPVSIDAAQTTAGHVGSRGDREASRHRSEFGLPRVGGIVAISVGSADRDKFGTSEGIRWHNIGQRRVPVTRILVCAGLVRPSYRPKHVQTHADGRHPSSPARCLS
jgi:hypothetical protein